MTQLDATRMEGVLAGHLYETEFLGSLGEVWTTCTCGERIDATPANGRSAQAAFKANWSAHVADALAEIGLVGDAAPADPDGGAA